MALKGIPFHIHPLPSLALLNEALSYDPDSGQLTWRERPRHHFPSEKTMIRVNTWRAGKPAGGISGGRLIVRVFRSACVASRICWTLKTQKELSTKVLIDHRNGDNTDNKWDNLRESTHFQNNSNTKVRSDSKSRLKGVVKRKNRWYAEIQHENTRYWLGGHATKGLAAVARAKAALRLHGSFARLS